MWFVERQKVGFRGNSRKNVAEASSAVGLGEFKLECEYALEDLLVHEVLEESKPGNVLFYNYLERIYKLWGL